MKKIILSLIVAGSLFACGDDNDAPKVTIASPADGLKVTVNDTLSLDATITDDSDLVSVSLTSTLGLNETITTLESKTSHRLRANLTLDPNTSKGTYTIKVEGKDGEGETGSSEVTIEVE